MRLHAGAQVCILLLSAYTVAGFNLTQYLVDMMANTTATVLPVNIQLVYQW